MKIKDDKLIIDEEMNDEMVEEFVAVASDEGIKKIVIENPAISSSIVQAILCFSKEKKIKCEDAFLSKFFENVHFEHP